MGWNHSYNCGACISSISMLYNVIFHLTFFHAIKYFSTPLPLFVPLSVHALPVLYSTKTYCGRGPQRSTCPNSWDLWLWHDTTRGILQMEWRLATSDREIILGSQLAQCNHMGTSWHKEEAEAQVTEMWGTDWPHGCWLGGRRMRAMNQQMWLVSRIWECP